MSRKKKVDDQAKTVIKGNVSVSNGDFVGGDKTTTVGDGGTFIGGDVNDSNVVTGSNNTINKTREQAFKNIINKIKERPNTSSEDKEDLKANVEELKTETDKNEQADESFIARRLRNIQRIAPDIAEVVFSTITNPAAGFSTIVKKIAERAAIAKS